MAKAWKELERKTAKLLNGQRLGGCRCDLIDVISQLFDVECKYRRTLPAWVKKYIINYQGKKKPLLVMKEKGKHDEYVTLKMSDFVELIKK